MGGLDTRAGYGPRHAAGNSTRGRYLVLCTLFDRGTPPCRTLISYLYIFALQPAALPLRRALAFYVHASDAVPR